MYFGTKYNKIVTKLLLLQEPKGGRVNVSQKTNGFWKFEQEVHGGQIASYLTIQPLLLFNKIISTSSLDKPIQDHDVIPENIIQTTERPDQEILCMDNKDTLITAYYDTSISDLDSYYTCASGLGITGDIDTIEKEIDDEVKTKTSGA